MNRKDRQREQILSHGFKLQRIFFAEEMANGTAPMPVTLCKLVHRIESRAHNLAERECNGYDVPENWEDGILDALDRVLGFRALGIPVFVNGDPRGYALKIDDAYVKDHGLDIYRDWGGYGIIAPEFDGD